MALNDSADKACGEIPATATFDETEWVIKTVEELVAENVLAPPLDGNHGAIHPKGTDFIAAGIPFIMASDMKDGEVDIKGCSFISSQQAATLRKGFSKKGDVLLSHKATIGRTALVGDIPTEFLVLTPQVTYYRVLNRNVLNNRYLKYYFDSRPFQETLGSWAGAGSTRAYLGITAQRKLPIVLPPIQIQNEIASVIGALDDRIALLRETNATLEAMAQALLKSWFVDFDPVHANAGTRAATLPADLQALFPSTFTDTPQGLVPEGWNVSPLDAVASYLNGLALQKFPPTGHDDLPVIKIAQLKKGDTGGADQASRSIKPEYIIQNGDVLFSWSGSLEVSIWCGGEGALNQHLFKVASDKYPKWFYYLWTRHHLPHFQQIAASKATTMGHIQRKHLTEALTIIPSPAILSAADEALAPLIEQVINNALQAQTLATLRDTLLPRLISGQLRLPDAEAALAEVGA